MKNIMTILFVICQVVVYGQFDKPETYQHQGPNYLQTIYPKDDGYTYNQYVGETIAGYTRADGWRQDSINGGFNKEIYDNPYISSQGDYVGFNKDDFAGNLVFYRYKKGKKYSGKILDTLDLMYTPPVVMGMLYGNPYFESKNIKIIFGADCINGLIQGVGTILVLNTKELISNCYFENGEIIGETIIRGIYSNNIFKSYYEKGSAKAIQLLETDKDGNIIIPANNDKYSFKATYLTLLDPYRFLDQREKAKQVYLNQTNPNFQNPLFREPIDKMLYYFSHIGFQKPYKKYKTKNFEISEFKYEDIKVVFCAFNQPVRGKYTDVIECYDSLGRLIIVRNKNVFLSEMSRDLEHPDYEKFYDIIGNDCPLTVFMYDDNNNITKASIYKGIDGDFCNYVDDFTDKILSYSDFKPISIISQNELKTIIR